MPQIRGQVRELSYIKRVAGPVVQLEMFTQTNEPRGEGIFEKGAGRSFPLCLPLRGRRRVTSYFSE